MTDELNKQGAPTGIDFIELADRLRPVMAAYAGMTDAEVARAVWRKQMIAAGVCADCAAAGETHILGALDKVGAFLDKAASGFVQLYGVLKHTGAADNAQPADQYRPRETDPLARAIETWASQRSVISDQ